MALAIRKNNHTITVKTRNRKIVARKKSTLVEPSALARSPRGLSKVCRKRNVAARKPIAQTGLFRPFRNSKSNRIYENAVSEVTKGMR
jgi:hypothetical protein